MRNREARKLTEVEVYDEHSPMHHNSVGHVNKEFSVIAPVIAPSRSRRQQKRAFS